MQNQALRDRRRLPSKADINAITSVEELQDLLDHIDFEATKIETALEHSSNDSQDWEARAISALVIHRVTRKAVAQRLAAVAPPVVEESDPPIPRVVHPRVAQFIEVFDKFDVQALTTVEAVERALEWLREETAELRNEIDDEKGLAVEVRDTDWLRRASGVLAKANALRNSLQQKAGEIRRQERAAEFEARDRSAERLFIKAVKRRLDEDVYAAIWEEVFIAHPELRIR